MAPPAPVMVATTPLNLLWLLHTAIEAPLAFVGLFFTYSISWEGMNELTSVIIKLYSCLSLSLCVVSLLLYSLPDHLPGKRAAAIMLLLYHGAASSVLLNAESFTGVKLFSTVTPEKVFGVAHGVLALMTTAWWQATLGQVKAASAPQGKGGKSR